MRPRPSLSLSLFVCMCGTPSPPSLSLHPSVTVAQIFLVVMTIFVLRYMFVSTLLLRRELETLQLRAASMDGTTFPLSGPLARLHADTQRRRDMRAHIEAAWQLR
jgi:hypothetical protein